MSEIIHRSCARLRTRLGTAAILIALVLTPTAIGAAEGPSENDVQAAYLFNFARYVEWPSAAFGDDASPIRICVLGRPDFVDLATSSIDGRKVTDRSVVVEARDNVLAARNCHILYLDSTRAGSQQEVVSTLSGRSVFTVSESDGFAAMGGVANFVTVDNKVRFEINRNAADRAGLKISSRLLRIAQIVD